MSLSEIWVIATNRTIAAELAQGAHAITQTVNAITIGGTQALAGADLTLALPEVAEGGLAEDYAKDIAELLSSRGAKVVISGADVQSRLLAGKVAAYLGTSPVAVADIAADAALSISRMAFGGLAVVTEEPLSATVVLTIGAGVLPAPQATVAGAGQVEQISAALATSGLRLVETQVKQEESVNLAAAKFVVGVGRGFSAEPDLALARAVAEKLGAEVACSRPIAEGVNWLPAERYIGVSGATIRPELYLAIGISGQVQHMVGVNKAKTLVAINKDKNAPIFKQVDVGIVGDLYEVLPALVAAL